MLTKESYSYFSDNNFSEDAFEYTIIDFLVQNLGYTHLFGPDVPRSSEKFNDVFLPNIFEENIYRINSNLPTVAVDEAINKVKSIENGSLFEKNDKFNDYLQSGVEVSYLENGQEIHNIVQLMDYTNPLNNFFHVVNQWTFIEHSNKRPDIIIFINGMPLVLFELKSPSREETDNSDAYLQLRQYMRQIPSLFVPNAFCVLSDMSNTRVGTITADEDRYCEWKSEDGTYNSNKHVHFDTMLNGMCEKHRLVDIIDNFICYNNSEDKQIKILAGYHQYFAVKKSLIRTHKAIDSRLNLNKEIKPQNSEVGKIGVFWHTQGSGKSLSMVFFAHLLNKEFNNPTIVVITDRNDLDNQLYGQFCRCSKFLRQTPIQAKSQQNLKKLLKDRASSGIIFTTMQKFSEVDEPLCERRNLIVMVDEAHRGQYGLIEKIDSNGKVKYGAAKLVRDALPNASYIGFTGTPISTDDKNTREIFGEYIDIYDMTQAVDDNATRPVFYESRVVALGLNENILSQLDKEYDEYAKESQEFDFAKSKRQLGGLDAIFATPKVIDSLCKDIIEHYEKNREHLLSGKALIVAYSRSIAIKLYKHILELRPDWKAKLGVVMTMSNQDPEDWFDICGGSNHKTVMEKKFKDNDDPFKIAIVVDMWLTGFDVPSLSTMYLFKPMQGHNLMQAIARVNRVHKKKVGGLVVDYIGIARALKQAMKDYTNRDKQNYGDMDIAHTAYPKFKEKLEVVRDLLYKYKYLGQLFTDERLILSSLINNGVDYLLDPVNDKITEDFLKQTQLMGQALSLCKSMVNERDQHEAAFYITLRVQVLRIKGRVSRGTKGKMTPEEFNYRITSILEQAVTSEGTLELTGNNDVEISIFDESFLDQLKNMKEKNIAYETLKRLIEERVKAYNKISVVKANKFSEMLQNNVNAYLNGMLTNEDVMRELIAMAHEMSKDRDDAKELGFDEEEMAFYDALTKPEAVKDFYSNEQLKSIVHELTDTLRKSRTIDWQKKESARAGMRSKIKRLLKKYKYPPSEAKEAMEDVMAQCELWADTQEF